MADFSFVTDGVGQRKDGGGAAGNNNNNTAPGNRPLFQIPSFREVQAAQQPSSAGGMGDLFRPRGLLQQHNQQQGRQPQAQQPAGPGPGGGAGGGPGRTPGAGPFGPSGQQAWTASPAQHGGGPGGQAGPSPGPTHQQQQQPWQQGGGQAGYGGGAGPAGWQQGPGGGMGRGPFPTTHAGRGGAHQPPFLQQQYPQQQQPQYPGSNQQHHSNTTTNSMAYNHGGPPPNNLQQQQLPVMRAAPMAATSAMPTAGIVVSKRQQGNPVLKYIRNVSWQFGDIGPDYLLGQNACALFLSLRYHLLHPDYILVRIKELQRAYALRLLLVHVDVEDVAKPLGDVARAALLNDVTLVCAWSAQECARYLETFKAYESRPAAAIQERVEHDYASRLTAALTAVRGVNRTDALTLGTSLGTLADILKATPEQLSACPGVGPIKVQRLLEAFHQPFKRQPPSAAATGQGTAGSGAAATGTAAHGTGGMQAGGAPGPGLTVSQGPQQQPGLQGPGNMQQGQQHGGPGLFVSAFDMLRGQEGAGPTGQDARPLPGMHEQQQGRGQGQEALAQQGGAASGGAAAAEQGPGQGLGQRDGHEVQGPSGTGGSQAGDVLRDALRMEDEDEEEGEAEDRGAGEHAGIIGFEGQDQEEEEEQEEEDFMRNLATQMIAQAGAVAWQAAGADEVAEVDEDGVEYYTEAI